MGNMTLFFIFALLLSWSGNDSDMNEPHDSVLKSQKTANESMAESHLKSLKYNCEVYRIAYKKWPENLQMLVDTPDKRKIIEEVSDDPWGNPYNFEKNGYKIKIYSSGVDGLPNTDDDIVINVG